MPSSTSSPTSVSHSRDQHLQQQQQPLLQEHHNQQPLVSHPAIQDDKLAAVVAAAEVAASMYDAYQEWALKTYGDSAKTKTVTKKKYNRIMKILRGEESSSVENSKFRFWVKAKGFKIASDPSSDEDILFVPATKPGTAGSSSPDALSYNSQNGSSGGTSGERKEDPSLPLSAYKRVAVVENFYDIIYNVHVEMDGRSGKHAGQKRTYRAVAERYAFLPREAVTRFLMSCSDCQKRMHLQNTIMDPISAISAVDKKTESFNGFPLKDQDQDDETDTIATAEAENDDDEVGDLVITSPTPLDEAANEKSNDQDDENDNHNSRKKKNEKRTNKRKGSCDISRVVPNKKERGRQTRGKGSDCKKSPSHLSRSSSSSPPFLDKDEDRRQRQRDIDVEEPPSSPQTKMRNREKLLAALTVLNGYRGIQPLTLPSSTATASQLSLNNSSSSDQIKVEVDDDDDDDEEENDALLLSSEGVMGKSFHGSFDPERLKAFNMFVRLFVDENLDRMVPISRQPKEKIQAIIDSCGRQFPEFSDRARKRIRTYLKSCRRNRRPKGATAAGSPESSSVHSSHDGSVLSKKSKENGIESEDNYKNHKKRSSSPFLTCSQLSTTSSSYHLTSPLAEQILAAACDNEYQNVKRIKLGLQPIVASSFRDVDVNTASDTTDSTDHVLPPSSTSFTGRSSSSLAASTRVSPASAAVVFNGHGLQPGQLHNLMVNGCHLTTSPSSSTTNSCLVSPILSASSSSSAIQALLPSNAAHSSSSSLLAALCQQQQKRPSSSEATSFTDSSEKHIMNGTNGNALNGHKKLSNGILSDLDSDQPHLPSSTCATRVVMTANSSVISPSSSSPSASDHPPLSSSSAFVSPHQRYSLNPGEVAAVKQLISGYRESAAFLLRSADELEQLLLRQT